MNSREQYIRHLICQFKDGMLPSLAREEPKAMACMIDAHIEAANTGKLPIEFSLGKLFVALWAWGNQSGIDLPTGTNHQKDFEEFCHQLMEPWPMDALERVGLEIRLIHKSSMKDSHRYEISRVP